MSVSASDSQSPRIASLQWGRIETTDGRVFKDAKCWPGGAREWNWNETGTHHEPGIQVADFQELLDQGANVLVLSRGVWERLQVSPAAVEWLNAHHVDYRIAETGQAVKLYNELVPTHAVGALFHSTC